MTGRQIIQGRRLYSIPVKREKEKKKRGLPLLLSFWVSLLFNMVEASIPLYYHLEDKEYTVPYYTVRNDYKKYQNSHTPIIIDNGSYQCKAGYASEKLPTLIFDNVVSKYKDRRLNANVLAVGMDALADPAARSNSRSPFESNVVCDFERMVRNKRWKQVTVL
ncbi:hypothetical protein BDB01DRAFT_273967 [Pilobolus umbonatus]|nr:hypothetical protein BDB01DRAFT_273967 [Pilobolus umbonatus]